MNAPSPDLDPRITRFAAVKAEEFSAEQVARILKLEVTSIYAMCRLKFFPAAELNTGKNGKSKRRYTRWTILASGLLRYIIRTTTGDRSLTLQAIAEHCPRWSQRAAQWAAEPPPEPAHLADPQPPSWLSHTPRAPSARVSPKRADPYAGHPDFFSTHKAG